MSAHASPRARRASAIEQDFALQLRAAGLTDGCKVEHLFHPVRKWRFDFAFPADKVAVELEGGVWSNGRHTRGAGFSEDCLKYNEATLLGWRVFRFTAGMVRDGSAIQYVCMALGRSL